jgi:hypothetical protein
MTLHWGAEHVQKCLPSELYARLSETYADPALDVNATIGLPVHNGKTGEKIMIMEAPNPCRVSRKKMRNLFREGLDIQYGKELVEIKNEGDKVRCVFADGTDAIGDIVVGCDGAKSKARRCICGEEKGQLTKVPLSMLNFTEKFPKETALTIRSMNPLFITSMHPDHGSMFWLSSKRASYSMLSQQN